MGMGAVHYLLGGHTPIGSGMSDQNPYAPPKAPVLDQATRMGRRESVRAIVVGGLFVDFGGTMLFASAVLAVVTVATGVPFDGTPPPILETAPAEVALSLCGLVFTVCGGYVAAGRAPRRPVLHAMLAGALSLVVGLPFGLAPGGDGSHHSQIITWLGLFFQVPVAAIGGHIWERRAA